VDHPGDRGRHDLGEEFQTVRAGYDRIGERYREWSQHSPVRLHWVQRLLDELQPDSLVIDLGCGPGEPATRMLAEHHRVCGVDASRVQLELARRVAPSAQLVQADMTRFALRPGSVDAVASFYALGHIPSHDHARLLAAIADWLRPGGLLLTSAPLSPGDSQDDDWLGVPMFFGGIGQQATRAAVDAAGLVLDTWEVMGEDEHGRLVEFIWLLARKPLAG
jgi:cyclopropane fatty-acyl-phospholipid synthase-like methyltransferase